MGSHGRVPRLVVETVVGWLLIVAGFVMLVTPGPGLVALLAGLAVLARHYRWAAGVKTWALARKHDTTTQLRAHRTARRAGGDLDPGAPGSDPGLDERPDPGGEQDTSSPTAA